VMSERGGGHIHKSFAPLMEEGATEAAGTSEVLVKKVSRKKKTAASVVAEKEVSSEGTLGITQESEAVVDKGMTKLEPKRLRKKGVISPVVGDNLIKIEEAAEEEAEEEETLRVRSRRQLPKAMSSTMAKSMDSEETKSDEVISKEERTKKRRQTQQESPGPSKKLRKAKSPTKDVLPPDSEVVGEDGEKEEVRFLIGNSSPTAKELEKEIDEILAQAIQHPFISESLITLDDLVQEQMKENLFDHSGGSDMDASGEDERENEEDDEDENEVVQREGKGVTMEEEEKEEAEEEEEGDEEELESEEERPPTKMFHLGVLTRRRLAMPHSKMIKRYADVLLGHPVVEQ
ncbi:hypothetical protein Dimus_008184, partial [Dionaea muscipula]